MKLTITFFLLASGMLVSAADKSSQAQCIADCKAKCTNTLNTCKKNATNKTAVESCQKSYEGCSGVCVNKTCSSSSAPGKK